MKLFSAEVYLQNYITLKSSLDVLNFEEILSSTDISTNSEPLGQFTTVIQKLHSKQPKSSKTPYSVTAVRNCFYRSQSKSMRWESHLLLVNR